MSTVNSFGTRTPLSVTGRTVHTYSLPALQAAGYPGVARLPYSMKILLENLLRNEDGRFVKAADIEVLARVEGLDAHGRSAAMRNKGGT